MATGRVPLAYRSQIMSIRQFYRGPVTSFQSRPAMQQQYIGTNSDQLTDEAKRSEYIQSRFIVPSFSSSFLSFPSKFLCTKPPPTPTPTEVLVTFKLLYFRIPLLYYKHIEVDPLIVPLPSRLSKLRNKPFISSAGSDLYSE